jgi:heat shock protein HtpX
MANVYDRISANKATSLVLVFLFIFLISGLGLVIGFYIDVPWFGLVIAAIIAVGMSLFTFFEGDSAVLSLSKAHEADRKRYPHYVNTVEGLAIAAGLPTPKAYVIEEESINAFATGRDPKHASIAVTTGALKKLNRIELEGVIGHEMSHIKNYDIRMMMLVAVLIGVTALLSDMIFRMFWFGGAGKSRDRNGGGSAVIVIMLVGVVLAIISPIIAQVIRFSISRRREYLADADGALLTRHPKGLADALEKIKNDSDKIVDTANKATAHLYIENPLRKEKSWLNNMFNTHPPIDERIAALRKM